MTINSNIPDEVLLEIFDSYREDIDPYDQWRKQHVWIYLTHVCRRWRAVMLASSSRLDLGITIGPQKPGHIKTILSGPLPIFVIYESMFGNIRSARWRMLAALKHRDRVREISFQRMNAKFDKFFKETQCAFPILESLSLSFTDGYKPNLPDTFLGGPDLYNLHLRRLKLENTTLASISRFLSSATALTDLSLRIDIGFHPSAEMPEMSLLACLQGMPCLYSLNLSLTNYSTSQPPTHKNIVILSKLTHLYYTGFGVWLDVLVAGISAPSLRNVDFKFSQPYYNTGPLLPPVLHLPRFISEIEEYYPAIHVVFTEFSYCLSLLTQSEYISHCKPRFNFGPVSRNSQEPTLIQMSNTLSTRLTSVDKLRLTFGRTNARNWDVIPLRRLLQLLPSVKALQTESKNNYFIARVLKKLEGPDDNLALLPALEEIELAKDESRTAESQRRDQLAVFEPLVSARQQAGRTVKVFFGP